MAKCGEWGGNGGAVKAEMLTAKEMVDFVHGTGQEYLDNNCSNRESDEFKTLEWTGSSQERREVESRLEKMFDSLSSPRGVISKQQLSHGTWDLASRTALVTKHLGKHFEFMGTGEGPHVRLVGEEALFLLETGSLNLELGGVSVSVQQAYQLMLGEELASKQYLVYSKLIKSGFKVVRHQGDLGITSYERQIGLHQYQKKEGGGRVKQVKAPALATAPVVGRRLYEEEVMVLDLDEEEEAFDCDNDEIVEMIVKDLIGAAVDYCEDKVVEVAEAFSPNYEPTSYEDIVAIKCGLCAVIHPGVEETCRAKTLPKRCKFCQKLGHLEKVHWEVDPEFRKKILEAVNRGDDGEVFTEQMMWGHFADIASDDEEDGKSKEKSKTCEEKDDEIIELNDSSDDEMYRPSEKVIEEDSEEEEEIEEKSVMPNIYKNPFHSEELEIVDVDSNEKSVANSNDTEKHSRRKTCDKNFNKFNQNFNKFNQDPMGYSNTNHDIGKTPHHTGYSDTNGDFSSFIPNQFCSDGSSKYKIQDPAETKIEKMKRQLYEISKFRQNSSASSGLATQYAGLVYAFCDVCKLECSSKAVYDSHMVGKKHLKMLVRLKSRPPEPMQIQVAQSRIRDTEVVTVEEAGPSKPENLMEIPNGFNKSSLHIKFLDFSLLPPGARPVDRVYNINLNPLRKSAIEYLPYEQLEEEEEETEEPPAKKARRSFYCEVCHFRLDNSNEQEILAHIQSEGHKMNLYDEDEDVIVIDDNEKSDEKRDRQIQQCRRNVMKRDFRGFWPKARITRPLAMAEEGDQVNYNFGHYSKPMGGTGKTKGKGAKPRPAFKGNKNLDKSKRLPKRPFLLPTPPQGPSRMRSDYIPTPMPVESYTNSNLEKEKYLSLEREARSHAEKVSLERDKCEEKRDHTENKSPTCIDILDDDDVEVILDDEEEEEDCRNASNNGDSCVDELSTGPLSSLWEVGGVTPLLRPEMASSTEEVMGRIKICEEVAGSAEEIFKKNGGISAELRVTYDLYLSTTNFRKSMKKLPDFYVIVMDCHDQVPDSGALLKLRKTLCEEVPFLMAIVNAGSVLFFSLSEVDLPEIVSMG